MTKIVHRGSIGCSLVFTLLLCMGLAIWFGPGLHLVLVLAVVLPVSNLLFHTWPTGPWSQVLSIVAIRSALLLVAMFVLTVSLIRFGGFGGQLGYGDRLQIDGSRITSLGYRSIPLLCVQTSALVGLAALATAFGARRRIGSQHDASS